MSQKLYILIVTMFIRIGQGVFIDYVETNLIIWHAEDNNPVGYRMGYYIDGFGNEIGIGTAIANDVDLLESLLIIEGVISIQLLCSPDVTRELLISYFSFDMQDVLRKSLNDLKLNFIEPLNMKEIEKMLKVHSS